MTKTQRRKARNAILALFAAYFAASHSLTDTRRFPFPGAARVAAQERVGGNALSNPRGINTYAGGQNRLEQAGFESYPPQAIETSQSPDQPANRGGEAAAVLHTMQMPPAFITKVSTALEVKYRNHVGVHVSPDVKGGRLVILAPENLQQQIQTDAIQFYSAESRVGASTGSSEARAQDGSLKVRLASITWREFEDSLQRVIGKKVPVTTSHNGEQASFRLTGALLDGTTIEVDRRENLVTVVAPEPLMAGWQQLIRSLDEVPRRPGDVMEILRIENAKPAPIQRAIRLLQSLPADAAATPARGPQGGRFQPTVFQQQPAAPAQQPQQTPQPPAAQPDQPQQPDAADDELGGMFGDLQIQILPDVGSIILRGSRRDVQRALDVIRQIEAQAIVTQPIVEIYALEHLNSGAAETLLRQLYDDVLAARQGEVNITSLDDPNALLLIGREEAVNNARTLIEKLDQPLDDASRLRVFRLAHASAADAEVTVRGFFADRPGVGEELRPGLGIRVRVLADVRTNSLIVAASPRDLDEVAGLIRQLDVEKTPSQEEIKVFPLLNSLAIDLAPVLQTAITGTGELPENVTRRSASLSILAVDAQNGGLVTSGILSGVLVTADVNANAIVVRGPSSSMSLIGELIRQLDRVPGLESLVKVFTIENGDALQLSQALQQLFGQPAAPGVDALGLAPATAGTSALVRLRFSVDRRTNSIIVTGSASDLEVVESILLRLDTAGFAERITEVIWLRHQSAPAIAAAITQYVQLRLQTAQIAIPQFQTVIGPYDLPDRDLIAVAEENTNSLLISVSPRMYQDVRRLIESLDRRPPMVLTKVVMAEVALDDMFELGGELGLQDSLLFDRGRALPAFLPNSTPGFNFNNAGTPNVSVVDQARIGSRAVSTFGLGTSSAAAGYGGFVLSAASDSFSLLLRSLQDAQRAQILSRPQIMTVDNELGTVQVGQQVGRIQGFSQQGFGLPPILAVSDIPVGLILTVRPRVGADGLISMAIRVERSSIDPTAGTPIGEGIVIPNINQTLAESTIVAYSGQTVIFGGLIRKDRTNVSRRVPYLSDIPLLGVMFRFDREIESRNELLVIMTPMLVTGDEDLDYVKQTESSRMSYCLADIVEMHGDVGLSGGYGLWGPAIGPTIYPDLHPTVDQFPVLKPGEIFYDDQKAPSVLTQPGSLEAPGNVEIISPPQPLPEQPQRSLPPQPQLQQSYPPPTYPPPTYLAPPIPSELQQSQRSTSPSTTGMPTAGSAVPAGGIPSAGFVTPVDFQFIDADAAAELSGFEK